MSICVQSTARGEGCHKGFTNWQTHYYYYYLGFKWKWQYRWQCQTLQYCRVHWWSATGGRNKTWAMMGWMKWYQLWGWRRSTHYTELCEENKSPTLWKAAGALATCTQVWGFCALLQHAGFYRLICALWISSREIFLSAWNLTVVSMQIRGTSFAVKNITLSQMEMVFFAHCL